MRLIWCGGCLVGQGYEVVVYIGLEFQTSIRLNDDYDMSKSQHFIHTTHPPISSSNSYHSLVISFSRTSSLPSPWTFKKFPTRTKNPQEFHQAIKPSSHHNLHRIYHLPYSISSHPISSHPIPSHPIPHQAPALPSNISNFPTSPLSPTNKTSLSFSPPPTSLPYSYSYLYSFFCTIHIPFISPLL